MSPKQARKKLLQYLLKYNGDFSFYSSLKKASKALSLPAKHSTFFADLIQKKIFNLFDLNENRDSFDWVITTTDGSHYWPTLNQFINFLNKNT